MRFVCSTYVYIPAFTSPASWLKRIRAYGGILDALAETDEVVSIEQINYEGEYVNNGVKYFFRRFTKIGKYFPFKHHLFIKRQKPDVVVIQSLDFPWQVIQLRLMLGKKVKIIVHNHAEKPFTGIKKHMQKLSEHCVDAYLFASQDMGLGWIKRGNLSNPKKIREVMEVSSVFSPINKQIAKQKTGIRNDEVVYLWVGGLDDNKDPITAVKAFLKFALTETAARLYMIFQLENLSPQVQQLLAEEPNRDAVVLVGKLDNDELLYWYNSADYFISCSHYEGSGTAVCEAMSCGCVPIVTDIQSFRMMTDKGQCGLLFEAGDHSSLLAALTQSRQIDMDEMRRKVLEHYMARLSFNAIARDIRQIAADI
jgi:glycosyltransferase involved in cell wall biosynthesis